MCEMEKIYDFAEDNETRVNDELQFSSHSEISPFTENDAQKRVIWLTVVTCLVYIHWIILMKLIILKRTRKP